MAQQVQVDTFRLEPRSAGEATQDQEGARARERPALRVEEQLRPVALVEVGAAVREVAAKRLHRVTAHRHDALLVALADAPDEPLLEIDARAVEADGLAH